MDTRPRQLYPLAAPFAAATHDHPGPAFRIVSHSQSAAIFDQLTPPHGQPRVNGRLIRLYCLAYQTLHRQRSQTFWFGMPTTHLHYCVHHLLAMVGTAYITQPGADPYFASRGATRATRSAFGLVTCILTPIRLYQELIGVRQDTPHLDGGADSSYHSAVPSL
jgi:hypothetical protein